MASWRPRTQLEKEVVSLQPECNFIYGNLSDNQKKLQNRSRSPRLDFLNMKSEVNEDKHSTGLHAIRAVQKMPGARPYGAPECDVDLNDEDNLDLETVAMIRHCGMGPTVDIPLNEKTTLPTFPIPKTTRVVRQGQRKFPIIFDDDYFKVETTRSLNKKLLQSIGIDSLTQELNGVQFDKENSPIAILNEPEVKEPNKEDITAREYEAFIAEFPKLGKGENESFNKRKSMTNISDMKGCTFNNNEIVPSSCGRTSWTNKNMHRKMNNSISSPSGKQRKHGSTENIENLDNSSASSFSFYESFETYNSNNSSTYLSANESPNWRCKSQEPKNGSYANMVKDIENENSIEDLQKRYYTPKEVYVRKRHP